MTQVSLVIVTYCEACDRDRTMVYKLTRKGTPVYQCQCGKEVAYEGG